MRFFDTLKEKLRNKSRDNVCVYLCSIGLDARMVERGRPEERIGEGRSLGLIEIRGSPIRWVNLIGQVSYSGPITGGGGDLIIVYLIPDSTISTVGHMDFIRVKRVPALGPVVGAQWKGNTESNIISQLNQDVLLNQTLIRLEEQIRVQSHPECMCWAILISRWRVLPSRKQWDCYETIARHLLESRGK